MQAEALQAMGVRTKGTDELDGTGGAACESGDHVEARAEGHQPPAQARGAVQRVGAIRQVPERLAVAAIVGLLLPARHEVTRSARVRGAPAQVYALVRDVGQGPSWRTGLKRVELLEPREGHPRRRGSHGSQVSCKPPSRSGPGRDSGAHEACSGDRVAHVSRLQEPRKAYSTSSRAPYRGARSTSVRRKSVLIQSRNRVQDSPVNCARSGVRSPAFVSAD